MSKRAHLLDRARAGFLPEAGILLLAALARFWRLSYHSIWFDEAVSLEWAGADVAYTWDVTFDLVQEKHPPVYYILLHGWQELLGFFGLEQSDASLRASGAALGVLTVLGLLLLARRLSGRRVALLAGLLAALSPVLVWYSQELRMFQPAATALVWAGYFMVRAWEGRSARRRAGWWLAMCAALLAALYSYLFSAFVLPAAGLSLFVLWARDRGSDAVASRRAGRRLAEGVAAYAVVALLFLPLARNAWLVNSSDGAPGTPFAGIGGTTLHLLQVFTIWRPGWPRWLEIGIVLLAAGLALCGLLLPRGAAPGAPRDLTDRLWLGLWLGAPFLIGNALLATSDSIFGEDRYFLFLAPILLWAAARGAACLYERIPALGAASYTVVALGLAAALPVLWTPSMARENWRAAADLMLQHTQASPGLRAAAIAHVDYTHMPLEWYVRQAAAFDDLPIYFPFGGTLMEDQVESVIAPPLAGVETAGFDTLWLMQSHLEGVDDARLVQRWLDERYPLVTEAFPAGISVRAYAIRSRFDALPAPVASGGAVEMAPGLFLAACEITTPEVRATDKALHPPSGWAHVRLWWQATAQPEQGYTARIQVVNDEGVWGESLARDGDALRRVTAEGWNKGQVVRHEQDVNLNPLAPAGDYDVVVRLLDGDGREAGPQAVCGPLRIIE